MSTLFSTTASGISSRLLEYLFVGQRARVRRIARCLAQLRRSSTAERLPPEILSYIFLHAAHDSDDRTDTITMPIIVSQVCTRWRRIALNTSALWTSITLTNPYTPIQKRRTEVWLSRSKHHSLDLLLDFRDATWDWDEESHSFKGEDMGRVLDLLLPHVVRWRRFELLSDTWLPVFAFLERTQHVESAPQLEEIALSRCNAYFAAKGETFSPVQLRDPIPILGSAALGKLRAVSLAGVHIDWTSPALRGLSELEMKYHASDVMPSFEQFKSILAACPDLLKLSILGWGPRPPLPPKTCAHDAPNHAAEPSIRLPKLTHFSFGFVDLDYTIDLLSMLSCPSLEYLSIEDVSRTINPMEAQDATLLMEWLARDKATPPSLSLTTSPMTAALPLPLAHITNLQFNGLSASKMSMTHFFRQCSSLRSLHLSQTDSNSILLSALHPLLSPERATTAPFTPCPDLTELSLDSSDFDVLTDLVTRRSEAGHPSLKRVFVEMAEEEEEDCRINDITRAVFDAAGITLLAFSP